MTRSCPNCGSTMHEKMYFIRCNTDGASFWEYKCGGCGCEYKDVPKIINGKEVARAEAITPLEKDRIYEVVVGENHISHRMKEEEAINYVNRLRRMLPNKNIYYRIAKR